MVRAALIAIAVACAFSCGGHAAPAPANRTSPATPSPTPVARVVHRPPVDVYAAGRPGRLSPVAAQALPRVYVPNSLSNTVDVLSQRTGRVLRQFATGALSQHVTPSWDL